MTIPVPNTIPSKDRIPQANKPQNINENLLFSFELVERNNYFNLDGTCQNWAADLFDTLQKASKITIKEVYSKQYSGKSSPFRIHPHLNVQYPCSRPENVSLENMWQIRISKSKGGIHGFFVDNVFYVIWFDPQHNLYPDENHGGLKKVTPPSTCCKDRDIEVKRLKDENDHLQKELNVALQLLEER